MVFEVALTRVFRNEKLGVGAVDLLGDDAGRVHTLDLGESLKLHGGLPN